MYAVRRISPSGQSFGSFIFFSLAIILAILVAFLCSLLRILRYSSATSFAFSGRMVVFLMQRAGT